MIKRTLIISLIIVGSLLLSGTIVSTAEDIPIASNTADVLGLQEGMKYEYLWQNPEYDFFRIVEIYVIRETSESWKGIAIKINPEENTTFLYKFKVDKEDLALYTTDTLSAEEILDEEVKCHQITEAEGGLISGFLVILYNKWVYDFDMDKLIADGSVATTWGGMSTKLEISGPVEYENYTVYEITTEGTGMYQSVKAKYYVSSVKPYLLIDEWLIPPSGEFKILSLKKVEIKTFDVSEYNVVTSSNMWPVANFTYSINNLTVEFNSSSSYDSDGKIVAYHWDFGDGSISYEKNPTYTYESAGTYDVKLEITDDEDATRAISKNIITTGSSAEKEGDKGEKDGETPGFEFVFMAVALALVLFWKRKKLD